MKVLFIGIGSIASRHIKNLRELLGSQIHITALRSGKGCTISAEQRSIDRIIYEKVELETWYDAIFITNPTSMHYATLKEVIFRSDNFFIEKPVFMTGKEDIQKFISTTKRFYVACPLRYTNTIQYLKTNIDFAQVYSIRCISSSYLPDWRPNIDYRKTYSANKELGGGVSTDLIHEWDYVNYLVGKPLELKSLSRKKSNLETTSDDVAVYIADYPDKVVEIHLDYFGRSPIRTITLLGRDDTIVVNLIMQRIKWLNSGKELSLAESRDDFQRKELIHFLDLIRENRPSDNDLVEACQVLKMTRGIL